MMRPVLALLLLVGSQSWAKDQLDAVQRQSILLLLQFEGGQSEQAIAEMKRELGGIMHTAGLSFDYKLRSELNESDTPADIIVIKFSGRCRMDTLPPLLDERGPYATTSVSDEIVLPFSEVACDRVRVSIRSEMSGSELRRGNMLLGRALGRILAHEIHHIVGNTKHHADAGVAKAKLSPRQLLAERLDFTDPAFARLH